MVLKIELLSKSKHIRNSFSCGETRLDDYIRKQASQNSKKNISQVYVLIDAIDSSKSDVLAYYTLSAYTISIDSLDLDFAKNLPRYPQLPATLLGRLAVDKRQQGKKYGELMLLDALKRALDVSRQIGSLAVVVETLPKSEIYNKSAINFYQKYGFKAFPENPRHLYLPMTSIKELFPV